MNGRWEYGVRHVGVDGWPRIQEHADREAADNDFATCGMNCAVVRREVVAGPWEPIA